MTRASLVSALLLLLLAAGPAAGDRVWLTNGASFEEVVVESSEPQVRIRLAHGTLSFPPEMVARIEHAGSALATYLERSSALAEDADSSAHEWLELALWARSRNLDEGARESALFAAELDPELDGLAPLMRRFGRVLDREAGLWVEYRPASPEAEAASPAPEAGSETVEERLAHAVELLALSQARQVSAAPQAAAAAPAPTPAPATRTVVVPAYSYPPVIAVAGWALPGSGGRISAAEGEVLRRELVRRQPGSLLPFPRPGVGGSALDRR